MPTTTVFGDASDGFLRNDNPVYLTARAGPANLADSSSTTVGGGQYLSSGSFIIVQGFLAFDTSAIGSDVVTSATLEVVDLADQSLQDFVLEARLHDWGVSLTTADFVPGDSVASKPLLATYDTTLGWTGNTYKALTDVAMVGSINGTGFTRLFLTSDRFRLGTIPVNTVNEYVNCNSADTAGTTSDPKLTIVTPPPPVASFGAPRSRAATQARLG